MKEGKEKGRREQGREEIEKKKKKLDWNSAIHLGKVTLPLRASVALPAKQGR